MIKIGVTLNKNVGSAAIIYKLHEFSLNPLSSFGNENLKSVFEVLDQEMQDTFDLPFFFQFYEIDANVNVIRPYERSYYFKYFELCKIRTKRLEAFKAKSGKVSNEDLDYIIGSASANLLREAENKLRLKIGAKHIGEGYINETALYYKIKEHFQDIKVLQHGRPDFLGRQHYDIWLTELKIAIEYHGEQHDRAIDFFVGDEAYKKNVERDQLKKQKSLLNNVTLLEVRKGYNLEDLFRRIEEVKKRVLTVASTSMAEFILSNPLKLPPRQRC